MLIFDEKAGPRVSGQMALLCEEWRAFSAFKQWFLTNYKEGWLNKFMTSFEQKEGRELPTGASTTTCYRNYKELRQPRLSGLYH